MTSVRESALVAVLTAVDPAGCDRGVFAELVTARLPVQGWLDVFDARLSVRAIELDAAGAGDSSPDGHNSGSSDCCGAKCYARATGVNRHVDIHADASYCGLRSRRPAVVAPSGGAAAHREHRSDCSGGRSQRAEWSFGRTASRQGGMVVRADGQVGRKAVSARTSHQDSGCSGGQPAGRIAVRPSDLHGPEVARADRPQRGRSSADDRRRALSDDGRGGAPDRSNGGAQGPVAGGCSGT